MYYQETANFIYSYDTTIPHGFISIEISNKQINIDNIISIDCGKSNNYFLPKDSNIFCHIPDNSVNGNGILADSYLLSYKIDADGAHFTKSYSQTQSHAQIKPNHTQIHHMIYCGRSHGVISIANSDLKALYQSKLNKQNNFCPSQLFSLNKWNIQTIDYISRLECIFAFEKDDWINNTVVRSSLFDLNQKDWIELQAFNQHNGDSVENVSICHDWNENNVFMIYNDGQLAQFNYNKNIWMVIQKDGNNMMAMPLLETLCPSNRLIWFDDYDPNLLYCTLMRNQPLMAYLDVRGNKCQWNRIKNCKPYDTLPFKNLF